ncbi:hypothetical protein TWF281_001293 [Arthrobotrys megalospora]
MTMTGNCTIEPNPDVTGLGIRVSIYALCIVSRAIKYIFQPFLGKDEFLEFSSAIDTPLGLQGLALLCTALYQTIGQKLTLFHAICCIHLLALLGVDLYSRGRYTGFGPGRLIVTTVINILAVCAFIAFNVYVWITAPTFGSQPECNSSTVYVVFGVSISATAPIFRYIILATLAVIPACIIVALILMLPCVLCIVACKLCSDSDSESGGVGAVATSLNPEPADPCVAATNRVKYVLANLAFCIYAIVSLEQTISRNNLDVEEKEWTFGQIIAVFLLLGVGNEVVTILLAQVDRRRANTGGSGVRAGRRRNNAPEDLRAGNNDSLA